MIQNVLVEHNTESKDIIIDNSGQIKYTLLVEENEGAASTLVFESTISDVHQVLIEDSDESPIDIVITVGFFDGEVNLPTPSSSGLILAGDPDGSLYWVAQYEHPSLTPVSLNANTGQVIDTLTSNGYGHITGATLRYLTKDDIPNLPISKIISLQTELDNRYTEAELQGDGSAEVHWNNITNVPSYLGNGTAQYQLLVTGAYPYTPTFVNTLNLVGTNGLNNLSYVSTSFVKMTGENTFELDTNTYSLSDHNHSHTELTDIGTNTHVQIDTHIADTSIHFADLSGFDTDDLAEGSANLYSQWNNVTGGINYSGGNVGIGTTSPSAKMQIYDYTAGVSDADAFKISLSSDETTKVKIGYTGWAGSIKLYNSTNVLTTQILGTGDSYFNGGNVGIGTASPNASYKLDVNGNGRFTSKLYLGTTTAPATDTGTLNALVYDPSNGEIKQRAISGGGTSISFGSDNQIPFTNSGGTNFDYESTGEFSWNNGVFEIDDGSYSLYMGSGVNKGSQYNVFLGPFAGNTGTGVSSSTFIGYASGQNATNSQDNTCIGQGSGNGISEGNRNTCIGQNAGYVIGNADNCVCIGYRAGRYETDSNKLFIDSLDRTNEATARTSSLIYGEFNSTVSSQLLRVNGDLNIKYDLDHDGSNIGFFGTTPVAKQTALTAASTNTVDTTYGTEEATVINNLRTRVNELEAKLQAYGLLS